MPEYLAPGVYVEETSFRVKPPTPFGSARGFHTFPEASLDPGWFRRRALKSPVPASTESSARAWGCSPRSDLFSISPQNL